MGIRMPMMKNYSEGVKSYEHLYGLQHGVDFVHLPKTPLLCEIGLKEDVQDLYGVLHVVVELAQLDSYQDPPQEIFLLIDRL